MSGRFMVIAVALGAGWQAVEVVDTHVTDQGNLYTAKCLNADGVFPVLQFFDGQQVADHESAEAAIAAVVKAQAAERTVRPFWQDAVSTEQRYRRMMYDAAVAAAQPANKVN